jgi:hypothetical protein
MTDQAPQRTRLSKSKATASTTAIQTLEITTIVTADDPSPPATDDPDDIRKSRHHHHHHVKSPVFAATGQPSPSNELELPPPLIKGPSEAIVALQDAANGQTTNTKEKKGRFIYSCIYQ